MERKVHVNIPGREYDVIIGRTLDYGRALTGVIPACRILLLSDDNVFALHGDRCVKELTDAGFTVETFVFPHGERSKTIATLESILEFMADCGFTRSDCVAALGGGVTGDIAGLCAALYMRGIRVIQFATSLLAAVDSSVGGKTAVDLKAGKNLIGAFLQPSLVVIDTDTFETLPDEYISDGFAEVVKYGMIMDRELFEGLEKDAFDFEEICYRCIKDKAEIVEQDECESGLRKILNFGHTAGHGIEALSDFTIGHGTGVAIGMMIVCRGAYKLGYCSEDLSPRLGALLQKLGLERSTSFTPEDIALKAFNDKKRTSGGISVILPVSVGEVEIKELTIEEWKNLVIAGTEAL